MIKVLENMWAIECAKETLESKKRDAEEIIIDKDSLLQKKIKEIQAKNEILEGIGDSNL